MSTIQFDVHGIPVAQPRSKACRRGKHAGVYDPGTANGWKALVAFAAKPHVPATPIDGPIICRIAFWMPRPKALYRKKDPEGILPATGKPDRDNLEKAVLDILTQIGMWRDDAQVYAGEVTKFYHPKAGKPGATIAITW